MNLAMKFIIPAGLVTVLLMAGGTFLLVRQQERVVLNEARELAGFVEAQTRTMRRYVTDHYVQPLRQSRPGEKAEVPLPATATIDIAGQLSQEGWFSARLVSLHPVNPRNGSRDGFERDGLKAIYEGRPVFERVEEVGGRLMLRRMTPDVASTPGCVSGCHEGSMTGDVLGGLAVAIPLEARFAAVETSFRTLQGLAAVLVVVFIFLLWLIVRLVIVDPLGRLTGATGLVMENLRYGPGGRPVESSLQHLAAASAEVAAGNQEALFDIRGSDEISRLARSFREMSEVLQQRFHELHELASCDHVTDLYNSRFFHENLEIAFKEAEDRREPLSLLMVDIDNFEDFNNQYGHQAGDAVLQAMGRLLNERFREVGLPCRYGGDELAVILPAIGSEWASRAAEELLRAVAELEIRHPLGQAPLPPVTVSLGLACFPDQAGTARDLLAAADRALYQAKNAGRNRFSVAPRNLQAGC